MLFSVVAAQAEPYWTDEWMVWLTGASVVTSGVLAALAYLNGRKAVRISAKSVEQAEAATRIAEEAGERDEAYREMQDLRFASAQQHEIALAMSRAANSAHFRGTKFSLPGPPAPNGAADQADLLLLEALTKVDLLHDEGERNALRVWFLDGFQRLAFQNDRENVELRAKVRRIVQSGIVAWNINAVAANKLGRYYPVKAEQA